MINIAKIAVSQALYSFDQLYDYRIPEELLNRLKPGMRVIVPFGVANKNVEGMVIETTQIRSDDKIKSIKTTVDEKPILDDKMMDLVKMMKTRYMCTWADAYKCMVPPGSSVRVVRYVSLTDIVPSAPCEQFIPLINILKNNGGTMPLAKLRQEAASDQFPAVLKKMISAGVIQVNDVYRQIASSKTAKVIKRNATDEQIRDIIESDRYKNIKYIRFLEVLIQVPYLSVADAKKTLGITDYMMNRLVKDNVAAYDTVKVTRSPLYDIHVKSDEKKKPNEQQQKAIDGISDLYRQNKFHSVLLYGITGSGKTEVYLQLIEQVLRSRRQVIVLVPEISLTPQTVARFKSRFQNGIAVFHSKLSQGERYDQWLAVLEGKIDIVIGARSAVFAPLPDLGMIIIDEEHENSYKSDKTPKYNALEIAIYRCKSTDSLLLLGSATPSINTWYKCENDLMHKFELTERATEGGMPDVETVDMRFEAASGNTSLFSHYAVESLRETFNSGKQAIILLNRRGYSQYVLCTGCGEALMCPSCSLTLKYHKPSHRLICHMCGYTRKMPEVCPGCQEKSLTIPGIGTQKAEEELQKLFPDISILRMDMDTVTRKNSYEKILGDFRAKKADVLLGTQMVAKGHDFPDVSLSVILSMDSMLYNEGYNATERTFQLILQASGRSGRGGEKGKVILQTYNPDHYVVGFSKNQDYKGFYRYEIDMRKILEYPPFCNLGYITVESEDDSLAEQLSIRIKASIDSNYRFNGIIAVLGPAKAPVERVAGKYIWRIIIKSKSLNQLIRLMNGIRTDVETNVKSKKYRLSVDINP